MYDRRWCLKMQIYSKRKSQTFMVCIHLMDKAAEHFFTKNAFLKLFYEPIIILHEISITIMTAVVFQQLAFTKLQDRQTYL